MNKFLLIVTAIIFNATLGFSQTCGNDSVVTTSYLKNDFGTVYLFSLAEYGAEKAPGALVQLFAEKEVRESFEKDFREKLSIKS